jgi:predicted RNase H-like HicB family nuclease
VNVVDEPRVASLATSYPRRFKILIKWDSRSKLWVAFIPEVGVPPVRGVSRDKVIESAKDAISSLVVQAASHGNRLPPQSYGEILDVEIDVPL